MSRIRTAAMASVAMAVAAALAAPAAAEASTVPTLPPISTGLANAAAVQVRLNLGIVPNLPSLPSLGGINLSQPQTLQVISSQGTLSLDTVSKTEAVTAQSGLAAGTLVAPGTPLAALNKTESASLSDPGPNTGVLATLPANPVLSISGGELSAQATKSPLGGKASSTLSTVSLGQLSSILPASLLSTLNSALSTVIKTGSGSLTSTINTAISTITGIINSTPAGTTVSPVLTELNTQLKALLNELPGLVSQIESGSIVSLTGVSTSENTSGLHGAAQALSTANVADVSLLGGFVTLQGFNESVQASAAGTPGSAGTIVVPNIAKVQVGHGLLDVALGPNGLITELAGQGLPSTVSSAIQTVVTALNSLVSTAGIHIIPAAITRSAATDGRSAQAKSTGLDILADLPTNASNLNPLNALLNANIGNILAAVKAEVPPAVAPVAKPAPAAVKPLAFTGANYAVAGLAAMLFLGIGATLRRRLRRSQA